MKKFSISEQRKKYYRYLLWITIVILLEAVMFLHPQSPFFYYPFNLILLVITLGVLAVLLLKIVILEIKSKDVL